MTKLLIEDQTLAEQVREYLRVNGSDVASDVPISVTIPGDKKAPRRCASGSGLMTSGGEFAPGYDAKLKSALYAIVRGQPEKIPPELVENGPMYIPVAEWTPERATAVLAERDWPLPVVKVPKPKKEKPESADGQGENGQTKASRRRMAKGAQTESEAAAEEERAKEDDHATV